MRRFVISIFFLLAISSPAAAGELLVSAASDLLLALKEIAEAYQKEGGGKVVINFGSSGMLAQQIEGGAPVDLFLSANRSYIERLKGKGFIVPESDRVYAFGRLAVAAKKETPYKNITDLQRSEVRLIAIANPGHAPYGVAAKDAMEKAGIWEVLKEKIVYGENVRQAMQYAETGNVDLALVALSLCSASDLRCTQVPRDAHSPIEQSLAVINGGRNEKEAARFVEYLTGPRGRTILERYGFER